MTKQDYEKMTLTKLKEVAKEIGIKNISKFKKDDLIEEILKVSPNSIEKEGVVLRESISPKPTTISTENVEIKNSSNSYNKEKRIVEDIKRDSDQEEKKERVKERINEASVVSGILEIQENNNFGFLRCKNYLTSSEDVYVSPSQIRRFNLRTGDEVQGKVREAKEGEKFKALLYVESVNGENPEKAIGRKNFETLIPIYPKEIVMIYLQD